MRSQARAQFAGLQQVLVLEPARARWNRKIRLQPMREETILK